MIDEKGQSAMMTTRGTTRYQYFETPDGKVYVRERGTGKCYSVPILEGGFEGEWVSIEAIPDCRQS